MARHTGLGGRESGVARGLDTGVAIAAIDPVVLDVVLVTEHDRLLRRDFHARDP